MTHQQITPLQQGIYDIVRAAARAGKPCPTNNDIAAQVIADPSSISTSLASLQLKGMISIKYPTARTRSHSNRLRIVTFSSDGLSTKEPEGFSEAKVELKRSPSSQPCWRCGSRLHLCMCGGAK